MNEHKGYYSLVQYCPDLGRLEAANLGVLVFCPERYFLRARMARSNARITKFFGAAGHDWAQINEIKRGFEDRVQVESADIRSLSDLEKFISLQANLLQVSPPRPMVVTDPEENLDDLFQEVIGERPRRSSARSLQRYIGEKFTSAGLDQKLRKDLYVSVPKVNHTLHVPFGYQNGSFNLIAPVRFEAADRESVFKTACKYAIEGRLLHETPNATLGELKLVVIGRFRGNDKESPGVVRKVLEDHDVSLVRLSQISTLIDEIRRTAKDVGETAV